MSTCPNIYVDLPGQLPIEMITVLHEAVRIRIERIVSRGHVSPAGFWYDQDQHEFVLLLEGAARLRFDDGEIEMTAGSFINIPAHRRHRVEWTDPSRLTIWLAVYYET